MWLCVAVCGKGCGLWLWLWPYNGPTNTHPRWWHPQFVEGEAEEDEEAAAMVAGLGDFGVDKTKQTDLFGNVVEGSAGAGDNSEDESAALQVTKDDLEHIVDDLSDDEDMGELGAKHAALMQQADEEALDAVKRQVESGRYGRASDSDDDMDEEERLLRDEMERLKRGGDADDDFIADSDDTDAEIDNLNAAEREKAAREAAGRGSDSEDESYKLKAARAQKKVRGRGLGVLDRRRVRVCAVVCGCVWLCTCVAVHVCPTHDHALVQLLNKIRKRKREAKKSLLGGEESKFLSLLSTSNMRSSSRLGSGPVPGPTDFRSFGSTSRRAVPMLPVAFSPRRCAGWWRALCSAEQLGRSSTVGGMLGRSATASPRVAPTSLFQSSSIDASSALAPPSLSRQGSFASRAVSNSSGASRHGVNKKRRGGGVSCGGRAQAKSVRRQRGGGDAGCACLRD